MNVGIAGAGAVGMGYAALLIARGHSPHVWSPSGRRTLDLFQGAPLNVSGALEGSFEPTPCTSAEKLADNDVIVLALPAYGYRFVIDGLLPHLEERHRIIFSGHLSFAALYLSKKLAERDLVIPIIAWNTTALTAKAPKHPMDVRVGKLRETVELAAIPSDQSQLAISLCTDLFGNRFEVVEDLITIALTNLNPQNHLAMVLPNFSRIEFGEDWLQNSHVTQSTARLMEALDAERVAIAHACGKPVSGLAARMEHTLGSKVESIHECYLALVKQGSNPHGPKSTDTRYVFEDVPFGLKPTLWLGKLCGVSTPLHKAGMHILNAMYDCDLSARNDLLPELGLVSLDELFSVARYGYRPIHETSKRLIKSTNYIPFKQR